MSRGSYRVPSPAPSVVHPPSLVPKTVRTVLWVTPLVAASKACSFCWPHAVPLCAA